MILARDPLCKGVDHVMGSRRAARISPRSGTLSALTSLMALSLMSTPVLGADVTSTRGPEPAHRFRSSALLSADFAGLGLPCGRHTYAA